jgi:hypothetical protein
MFGSDINSTDSAMQHQATLRGVRYGYGRVATADEIVAELRANAERQLMPVSRSGNAG